MKRNPHTLLTPAMHKVLERMERRGQVPLHALTPQQARAMYEAGANVLEPEAPKLQKVQDFCIPARDGHAIPVRLYADRAVEILPVLIYFHGGGFTVGSIQTHDALCRHLCHQAQCAVISVDYRLAPEFRFPTAVNDCQDVVNWVVNHGNDRHLNPKAVAVGGDSAGGTIAAACAIEARNTGFSLALQMLFYPGTCARQDTHSHKVFSRGFLLEEEHIQYFFGHYLGSSADRENWRFAPLDGKDESGNEVDLTDVAPAWIGLAECDPLVDEGIAYADRLRMAGVSVDLELYHGMVHEFIKMGRAIPEAQKAISDAARALKCAFHPFQISSSKG